MFLVRLLVPPCERVQRTLIYNKRFRATIFECWSGGFYENYAWKTCGVEAGIERAGRDRGRSHGSAWLAPKVFAKEKGGEVNDAMMEEFKSLVTEVLTPHASAILLDPEWGLPASKRRAKNAGLLLAYEKTGYDKTGPAGWETCWITGPSNA